MRGGGGGGGGSQQVVKAEPMEEDEEAVGISCLTEQQLADFEEMDDV